jgi:hypothetical protein
MVGGFLWVLWFLPPLKRVAMSDIAEILLSDVKHQKSNQIQSSGT